MTKNPEDFELFQKTFMTYRAKFGLTGYKVFFEHGPLEDGDFGAIVISQEDMTATVRLSSNLTKRSKMVKDPVRTAKHEALHLLTARLVELCKERFVSPSEIHEASEELAIKLEMLIPDILSEEVKGK